MPDLLRSLWIFSLPERPSCSRTSVKTSEVPRELQMRRCRPSHYRQVFCRHSQEHTRSPLEVSSRSGGPSSLRFRVIGRCCSALETISDCLSQRSLTLTLSSSVLGQILSSSRTLRALRPN